MRIPVIISERLYVPRFEELTDMYADIRSKFTHKNPDFYKAKSQGRWTGNIPNTIKTWTNVVHPDYGDCLAIPRGGTDALNEIAGAYDVGISYVDQRFTLPPIKNLTNDVELWPEQKYLAKIMFKTENCLIRSPTASGKTETLLKVAEWILKTAGPVLIIVWERELFDQWIERICLRFNLTKKDVGMIGGGKKRIAPLTVGMQQTLKNVGRRYIHSFGGIICDEIQRFAAPTFQKVVDIFPAKYRFGASADECVARGTKITLGNGVLIPIEHISVGDYVATPIGPRRVTGVFNTGIRATQHLITRRKLSELITTHNTLFATSNGWQESPSHVFLRNEQRHQTWMDNTSISGDLRCARIAKQSDDFSEVAIAPGIYTQTFDLEIEEAHCYYANDVLVHNSRKDGKQFLVYDIFGKVAGEVENATLINKGKIMPVTFRIVPTGFDYIVKCDDEFLSWSKLPPEEKDFDELLAEIIWDEERNELIWSILKPCLDNGNVILIATHRRESAKYWDRRIRDAGYACGLMLGGAGYVDEFKTTRECLQNRTINAGIGTIQKVSTGHDIPALDRGFVITPLAGNKQVFDQFAGRFRRTSNGKKDAVIYYFYDKVYPSHRNIIRKNYKGSVQELVDGEFLEA